MIHNIIHKLPVFFNLIKKKERMKQKEMAIVYLDKIEAYKTMVVKCDLPVKPISKMLKQKK